MSRSIPWLKGAGALAATLLLFLLSRYNYLLFHSLIEMFSAVVAGGVFILTLTLADTSISSLFLIIGCGQGVVAIFTLLHMLAYKGMRVFGTMETANLATQLWIATRLVDTGSLFTGVLLINKKMSIRPVLTAFAAIAASLLASLFIWPVFPDCFIEGRGLTAFKIATEYTLIGILLWSVWRLHSHRKLFSADVMKRLEAAYILHIFTGLAFTLYNDVYGLTNMLGHLFIFTAYLVILDVLVLHMVREIWFQELSASEAKFRSLTESSPDYIMRYDARCCHTFVNSSVLKGFGIKESDIIGKTLRESGLEIEQSDFLEENIRTVLKTAEPYRGEITWNSESGPIAVDLRLTPELGENGLASSVLSVSRDITWRKKTEESLRHSAEMQSVLREIAEAAVLAPTMNDLYEIVHRMVERVLPARLFHINLLDEAAGEIVVPFRADNISVIPARRPVDKGMTEYFMQLGHAAHITQAEMDKLAESGEFTLGKVQKVQIRHYLGAPLVDSKGKSFGVMSLIATGETDPFRPEDVEVLSIIAAQVSMAIERKQAEEALRQAHDLLESNVEKRTKELFLANQELSAMNEEFIAINDELNSTNDKLRDSNNELGKAYAELKNVQHQIIQQENQSVSSSGQYECDKKSFENRTHTARYWRNASRNHGWRNPSEKYCQGFEGVCSIGC